MSDWKSELYSQFNETVSNSNFPCLFAKKSQEMGTQEIFFYNDSEPDAVIQLRDRLTSYTETVKNVEIKARLYTPFLIFVKPSTHCSLKSYHYYAWDLIQKIHNSDPESWPEDIPTDPEHHLWSFCFNKVQLFINVSAPLHKFHRSRNLGSGLVLVINPRENFDFVAGNNAAGIKIRETIRGRCVDYDGVPLSPAIGFYNDTSNSEWRQYQVPEKGGLEISRCPLHIKNN